MKTLRLIVASLWLIPLPLRAFQQADLYDTVITGGRILNGSGVEHIYAADIGISGGKIVDVGYLQKGGRQTIDARGYWVTPGFIDLHSRSDSSVLEKEKALNSLYQGVTLVVLEGQAFPKTLPRAIPSNDLSKKDARGTPRRYLESLQTRGIALNVTSYFSSGRLRECVLGFGNRPATRSELEQMKILAATAMRDGAVGLSSRFSSVPGSYCQTDELIELARIARAHGGIYSTDLRTEGADPRDGLRECLLIAEKTGIGVEIEHMDSNAGLHAADFIQMIDKARKMKLDVEANIRPGDCEESIIPAIKEPWVNFGSADEVALTNSAGNSQSDLLGIFPSLVGICARGRNILSPEEMVYRMTWMAARRLNIKDRGRIAPGMAADLAIFKPEVISNPATYKPSVKGPRAIEWLLMNGRLVIDGGTYTGALPGEVIRGPGYMSRK